MLDERGLSLSYLSSVLVQNVLSCVMERVQTLAAAHKETQLFSLFAETAHSLISTRNMPTEDIISLHVSFSCFLLKYCIVI